MHECDFGEGFQSGVVNSELDGGLWVTHIDEARTQGDRILSIEKGGTYFGLGR